MTNSIEDAVKETIEKLESDPDDLPERNKEDVEIEMEQVATTDDTGEPCYKVEKGSSWMDLVHSKSKDKLFISHVWMDYRGDFSSMMDFIVQKFGTRNIQFTMIVNDNLKEVLEGFEEKKVMHKGLNEQMAVLDGKWNPNFSKGNRTGEK